MLNDSKKDKLEKQKQNRRKNTEHKHSARNWLLLRQHCSIFRKNCEKKLFRSDVNF